MINEELVTYVEVWKIDNRYQCSVRLWKTDLGEWCWSTMDRETQHGLGGWSQTKEDAQKQARSMAKVFKEDAALRATLDDVISIT